MAGQRKSKTSGSATMKQNYKPQRKIETVKNIAGVKSSNRPTIAKIGIQPKDDKGLVIKIIVSSNT